MAGGKRIASMMVHWYSYGLNENLKWLWVKKCAVSEEVCS